MWQHPFPRPIYRLTVYTVRHTLTKVRLFNRRYQTRKCVSCGWNFIGYGRLCDRCNPNKERN